MPDGSTDPRNLPDQPKLRDLRDLHRATLPGGWGGPVVDEQLLLRTFGARRGSVDLPDPFALPADLGSVLARRRSPVALRGAPLTPVEVSTLLRHAAGLRDDDAETLAAWVPPGPRAYPSGGALYPVEILVVPGQVDGMSRVSYLFQPLSARLVPEPAARGFDEIASCFANAGVVDAALLVLLVVDLARPSLAKYGPKEYRLLLLEAGHVAQNLVLVATALGLAALPTCGFDDARLATACGLDGEDGVVVHAVAVGGGGSGG